MCVNEICVMSLIKKSEKRLAEPGIAHSSATLVSCINNFYEISHEETEQTPKDMDLKGNCSPSQHVILYQIALL